MHLGSPDDTSVSFLFGGQFGDIHPFHRIFVDEQIAVAVMGIVEPEIVTIVVRFNYPVEMHVQSVLHSDRVLTAQNVSEIHRKASLCKSRFVW
jgi:hypothetical protein